MARASLEELKLDYEDYLRHRGLSLWPASDPRRRALVARRCATADEVAAWIHAEHTRSRQVHQSIPSIQSLSSIPPPTHAEIAANAAHTLTGVACALLTRQLDAQATAFEREGGFTERLYRVRSRR